MDLRKVRRAGTRNNIVTWTTLIVHTKGFTLLESNKKFTRKTLVENDKKEIENEFFETQRPSSLIQRFADPQEVANMIAYVASPLSSATNGASLRVDGGVVKYI